MCCTVEIINIGRRLVVQYLVLVIIECNDRIDWLGDQLPGPNAVRPELGNIVCFSFSVTNRLCEFVII